ncbi:hypothetical protein [Streptomyces fulvorobeus]|uniref:Lipopolysaccharide/colanic/teichoic acid biosynthesis glycosyltransferase n=1 Tax=Streptomyces fulvorobeus TaxID=284028 RepID=A0A7J0CI64_9ACTN|nr:hypothetical protein [Streptomyces fulvorobeus]NYE44856.1 lipopolysaccharide/colanic/teichoic acid biosynthesis glycosyltransferase [Streptomyces fulvorobeus]GFN01427.1 hypothetical protein Sfulv_62370 [Streptomyces fulvorobeus]
MSSLALIVAVLLVLVVFLFVAGLVYLAHRHPAWVAPLTVGLVGATFLAAVFVPIVVR